MATWPMPEKFRLPPLPHDAMQEGLKDRKEEISSEGEQELRHTGPFSGVLAFNNKPVGLFKASWFFTTPVSQQFQQRTSVSGLAVAA